MWWLLANKTTRVTSAVSTMSDIMRLIMQISNLSPPGLTRTCLQALKNTTGSWSSWTADTKLRTSRFIFPVELQRNAREQGSRKKNME